MYIPGTSAKAGHGFTSFHILDEQKYAAFRSPAQTWPSWHLYNGKNTMCSSVMCIRRTPWHLGKLCKALLKENFQLWGIKPRVLNSLYWSLPAKSWAWTYCIFSHVGTNKYWISAYHIFNLKHKAEDSSQSCLTFIPKSIQLVGEIVP